MSTKPILTNPSAAVVVWNYNDRMPSSGAKADTQSVKEIIIQTASIKSIAVEKNKANAAGNFSIELAPTFNWVARLTVGSWLAILMTRNKTIRKDFLALGAQEHSLKMLGRIDSVRVIVNVDSDTGTRMTSYSVTGRDWGCVFDTQLYIDSLAIDDKDIGPQLSHAVQMGSLLSSWNVPEGNKSFYSTTEMVTGIKNFFGNISTPTFDAIGTSLIPTQTFHFPTQVVNYCKCVSTSTNAPSKAIAEIIDVVGGPLTSYDTYDTARKESVGVPNVLAFVNQHDFWQIMREHSNDIVNEMVTEIRWKNGTPVPTLYKRVRPFVVNEAQLAAAGATDPMAMTIIKDVTSPFRYVRRTKIQLEDILTINAGTNWRDKINFIEILYHDSIIQETTPLLNAPLKLEGRIVDSNAATREGLKPRFEKAKWWPPLEGFSTATSGSALAFAANKIANWKYVLKDWYFNTHNMLNGSLTIVGQDQYIGVGENIMVPAKALGASLNFNANQHLMVGTEVEKYIYMLAHVESIAHNFTVSDTGARSFFTTVWFVRGIFTDENGLPLFSSEGGAIDAAERDMKPQDERVVNRVAQSTPLDSDYDQNIFKGN